MQQTLESPPFDLKASLKKPIRWAFGAGLVAVVVTLFLPNYYKSEVRLLPVESKGLGGNLGGLASAAAAFGVSVPGGDSSDANFVDVLNSRWLREQLLQTEFQFHTRSWRFGAEKLETCSLYSYMDQKNMDRALKELSEILTSSRDLKSKVILISAETKSPELSQRIVQKAGKLLEIFLQEKGRTRGGAKAAFAEARLKDARGEMDEAEGLFRRFLEGNRNYLNSADPAVRLKGTRLETELRLRQQLVTTLAMNREQALLEEKNDVPILNILDPGNLPIEKSKPARSVIVILVAVLVGASGWVWLNREWVKARILADDESDASVRESQ
ncbi:hypothetical protein [Geothrix sp. PMB-07]|uniref:hypothetical protein n=1 Tax=Geothrix sp. PMB-07 TaxID=3068640 RepID=UPI002740347C|nr:hypothetical protein [Geothrix sp. PMB-07]WLT31335.1 hypothetical protein Q9293_16590 [Geothrix sp. PMB-07]